MRQPGKPPPKNVHICLLPTTVPEEHLLHHDGQEPEGQDHQQHVQCLSQWELLNATLIILLDVQSFQINKL